MRQNNQTTKYLIGILSIILIIVILNHFQKVYSKKNFNNENGNGFS